MYWYYHDEYSMPFSPMISKDFSHQTANFVCSLCSLVLLTKNLLVEHMSLVHLEELEKLAQGDTHVEMLSKASSSQGTPIKDSQSHSSLPQQEGQSEMSLKSHTKWISILIKKNCVHHKDNYFFVYLFIFYYSHLICSWHLNDENHYYYLDWWK